MLTLGVAQPYEAETHSFAPLLAAAYALVGIFLLTGLHTHTHTHMHMHIPGIYVYRWASSYRATSSSSPYFLLLTYTSD